MSIVSGLSLMVLSSLGFAVMSALVKILVKDYGHFSLVSLRVAITSLIFFAILRFKGQALLPRKGRALLVFRGLAGFGGISCLFYGATHLPLAVATLLNWCSLVFVLLFSGVFLKERVSIRACLWISFSLVGLFLLVLPHLLGASLAPAAVWVGLLGAFFSAMAMTAVRAAAIRFSSELIIFYFSVIACLLALPLAAFEPLPSFSWRGCLLVLAMGISGSLAQYAMTRGYSVLAAGVGSTISLLTSAFSALLGWWFFDEILEMEQWLGVLILSWGVFKATTVSSSSRPVSVRGLAQTREIS